MDDQIHTQKCLAVEVVKIFDPEQDNIDDIIKAVLTGWNLACAEEPPNDGNPWQWLSVELASLLRSCDGHDNFNGENQARQILAWADRIKARQDTWLENIGSVKMDALYRAQAARDLREAIALAQQNRRSEPAVTSRPVYIVGSMDKRERRGERIAITFVAAGLGLIIGTLVGLGIAGLLGWL